MQMEQVNTWLASLESASIPPPDTIEFVNTYGHVDKMIQVPPKLTKTEKQTKRKSTAPSPPLPTKYLWQLSSKFPIRDRKGKGKAKSFSDEDKELRKIIDDTADQIQGALEIKDEGTSKLNYVIT